MRKNNVWEGMKDKYTLIYVYVTRPGQMVSPQTVPNKGGTHHAPERPCSARPQNKDKPLRNSNRPIRTEHRHQWLAKLSLRKSFSLQREPQ